MKEQRYEKIVELVRECGQLVKNADRQHLHVDSKAGHANFVTEYDKKVQERLRAGLCAIMPDAHFIGEEGSSQMFSLSPWDYAAGALIVKESGGLVSDINDRELAYDRQCSVVARNAVVQTIQLGT